ncbi:MAG: XdhC family protein [Cyclobacteriaceae bacterium]|nr:XdhC family protein [Cyclobacteriaceae bacterium]
MKELFPQINEWAQAKKPFAIARVVQTWGSSPRPVGSAMIISWNAEISGSVSGGCVEGSVIKESLKLTQGGTLLSYGVSDDEAWQAGLACGGKIQVYLQSYPESESTEYKVWQELGTLLSKNEICLLITSLSGENGNVLMNSKGEISDSEMPEEVVSKARVALEKRRNELVEVSGKQYFIQVFPKRNRMLIIGAAHITVDLLQLAKAYDFETIVIDPRGVFADKTQFVVAPDQLIVKYPSEILPDLLLDHYDYAVVLSHDPKIDDDALNILLNSKVAYIGALGSKKTHEKRVARLKEAGFSDDKIGRIESPIGVDINAQGAKEIALSIMGAVIKTKNLSA